jgi:hypothetical protein
MASVPIGPHCVYLLNPLVVLTDHTPRNIPKQCGRNLIAFCSPLKMDAVRSQQTFAYTDLATGCNSPESQRLNSGGFVIVGFLLFVLLSFLLRVGGGFECKGKHSFPAI